MSDMATLQMRAMEIRQRYNELSVRDGHAAWTGKEMVMGFVTDMGDMGELMELVMAKEGLRRGDDVDAKLAHELSDCLWSIPVLAKYYDVDLESEFHKTMDSLDARIKEMMQ